VLRKLLLAKKLGGIDWVIWWPTRPSFYGIGFSTAALESKHRNDCVVPAEGVSENDVAYVEPRAL